MKDRLHSSGLSLSGGQQQRLCIARAIAIEPEIILMDEPCSALDPIATLKIEELIAELKSQYTIVIVTHNLQQAARVSGRDGVLLARAPRGVLADGRPVHEPAREAHRGLHHREVRLVERHQFEAELAALRGCMGQMGRLVADQTENALGALVDRDADAARRRSSPATPPSTRCRSRSTIAPSSSSRCRPPAARDLRLVVATIKANTDLERIGDQAVNIAETALRLVGTPALPHEAVIGEMGRLAVSMTRDALASFLDRNVELAQRVLTQDDEADRLKVEIIRQLIAAMTVDGAVIDHAMGLVLISRNLERVADHATNMAEDAIFMVEARDVRHQQNGQA